MTTIKTFGKNSSFMPVCVADNVPKMMRAHQSWSSMAILRWARSGYLFSVAFHRSSNARVSVCRTFCLSLCAEVTSNAVFIYRITPFALNFEHITDMFDFLCTKRASPSWRAPHNTCRGLDMCVFVLMFVRLDVKCWNFVKNKYDDMEYGIALTTAKRLCKRHSTEMMIIIIIKF